MKRTKIIFLLCLILAPIIAKAQTYEALDDNYYVKPNSTTFTTLDILYNDALGGDFGCTAAGLTLTFPSGVTGSTIFYTAKGRFTVNNSTKALSYRPNTGAIGQDSLTYQWTCEPKLGTTTTKSATVYININDKPDFVSEANCYVAPDGITFDIKELARSSSTLSSDPLSNPVCGDIDNDGNIEIIVARCAGGTTIHNWDQIQIFEVKTSNGVMSINLQQAISVGTQTAYPSGSFAIAKVDGSEYASIFAVLTTSYTLAKYDYNPVTGQYTQTWTTSYGYPTATTYTKVATPLIVDIMGNGRTQVSVFSKLFDTKTGKLLVQGTDASNNPMMGTTSSKSAYSFGHFGHSNGQQSVMVAGDIDGDGIQELIGGDCVYKVHLENFDTQVAANTYKLYKRADKTGHAEVGDGGTGLADFDNDGLLDVVVAGPVNNQYASTTANAAVYIYNPRTGTVMHTNTITDIPRAGGSGPSMPFLGDLDGDGYTEFAITGNSTLRAYKYNPASKILELMWNLPTTDTSASTTLSMFDFAQDSKAKLVYRDETTLRIIDGRKYGDDGVTQLTDAQRTLSTFNNVQSGTVDEYPIVADVNGDGAAEIITVGTDRRFYPSTDWDPYGSVRVYGASGTKKWAPARTMWHQTAYNPLYVNDDLTVPAHPLSPSTAFHKASGGVERPFNNYLQQATALNREGTMIMLGADLDFNPAVVKRLTYDGLGNIDISFGLRNNGDSPFTGPIYVALWAQSGSTYTKVGGTTYANTTGLSNEPGSNTLLLNFTVPETNLPANFDMLFLTVNLSTDPGSSPSFYSQKECLSSNNVASGLNLVSGSLVMCEGEIDTVRVLPSGVYYLKWYNSDGTVAKTTTTDVNDNWLKVTKNSSPIQYYLVESYKYSGDTKPILPLKDTVFVYLSPSDLKWTGKALNQDWHDYQNWENISNVPNRAEANVPRGCTNVVIPDGVSNYPDLTDYENSGHTLYLTYSKAMCDSIYFEHGGEVQRSTDLNYNKAAFRATLNSHHWYTFSPPLKDFYTRDFYRKDVIPALDDIKTYARGWARKNPETSYYGAQWTNTFNTPNTTFVAGEAFGLWVSDKSKTDPSIPSHDPFSFEFPKPDTEFYIYRTDETTIVSGPYAAPRTNSHRFIFDSMPDASGNFNLKVNSENPKTGDYVLIGNPFFSNLDFDLFYTANSSNIQPRYYIPDEDGNFLKIYDKTNQSGSNLTKNIPPMQAFLVQLKQDGVTQLKANGDMSVISVGNKIKNASSSGTSPYIIVESRQDNSYARTFIGFDNEKNNNAYNPEEDAMAVLMMDNNFSGICLSSIATDGIKCFNNMMKLPELSYDIPLSVQTLSSGDITLNINNLPSIMEAGYKADFYDALTGEVIATDINSMYTFENIVPTSTSFIDNRFFIRLSKINSGIEQSADKENNVFIKISNGSLKIESSDVLKDVQVYNLQGQTVCSLQPNSSTCAANVGNEKIYIVKVKTDSKVISRKVFNN